MKYIVVTGGVLSGLGKGITTSSIGRLLQSRGLKVTAIKIDPYLNYDAGTMSPYQHGEVFVLDDGGEVDLDLGNYERFLDITLSFDHNITTGKVYKEVIEKERKGDYLGKTVQIIPHITDEIKRRVKIASKKSDADVTLIEVGGTVGDIESMPYLEAMRELHIEIGDNNILFVHTTLVPVLSVVGEQKTKPTQHSVKELRAIGIFPDIIICRGEKKLTLPIRKKISLFCDVPVEGVISAPDVESIYEIPIIFENQGLTDFVLKHFELKNNTSDLKRWGEFLDTLKKRKKESVNIAIIGKYVHLGDSYISHKEAFAHVEGVLDIGVNIVWIDAEDLEKSMEKLENIDGVLIPGGFGYRGVEGKMLSAKYARENNIPFVGVCLGFQIAVIDFARSVLKYKDANSMEFNPDTKYPVIDILPEQFDIDKLGGTMRLGKKQVDIEKDSKAYKIYGKKKTIYERHRHRYEVNPKYIDEFTKAGLKFTGKDEKGVRMEIFELEGHPFFIGSQFHPEFKSRPLNPSPLHKALVEAALANKK